MMWSDLNDAQYSAVTTKEHHVLVMAGAGTGKTRTIVARAHFLIESGIDPSRIAILSFTRKSAQEIVSRVGLEIGEELTQVLKGMTFHTFCLDLISRFPEVFGMSGYTLMDQVDQYSCMKLACTNIYASINARRVVEVASLCGNTFMPLDESMKALMQHDSTRGDAYVQKFESEYQLYGKAIAEYNEMKRKKKYLDFNDILSIVCETLHTDREARKTVCGSFDHILIDEMQDTNPLQYKIIESFADYCDLFCVGDNAQSIYGFRGADFKSIHSFTTIFPDAVTYQLNLNYRSTQRILDLANMMLARSPLDYGKVLIANRGDGKMPKMVTCSSFSEMASMVVESIKESHASGVPWSEHMVLARAGYKLQGVEKRLIQEGIPLKLLDGVSMHEQRHIRYVTSPLRIAANCLDLFAWADYIDLTKWRFNNGGMATNMNVDWNGIARKASGMQSLSEAITFLIRHKDVSEDMIRPLERILKLQDSPADAFEIVRDEFKDRIQAMCPGRDPEKEKDYGILMEIAGTCSSISQFIADYILDPKLDDMKGGSEDAVIVSTVHSAKGLEADSCYILDASRDEWPNMKSVDAGFDAVEEERRILYVAMTRAKNQLLLYRTDEKRQRIDEYFLDVPLFYTAN